MFQRWEAALLDECRVARLATINRDGRPNIVPVCYALAEGGIVIAVDEKPKSGTTLARIRNIERDARVSLLADRYTDDWNQLAWVRIEGQATVVSEGGVQPEALRALRARYSQYATMDLESRPLVVVEPARVVSWRWDGGGR